MFGVIKREAVEACASARTNRHPTRVACARFLDVKSGCGAAVCADIDPLMAINNAAIVVFLFISGLRRLESLLGHRFVIRT